MNPPETSEEKEQQVFGKPEASSEPVKLSGQNELNEKVARLCGIKPTTECPECWGSGYGGSEMDHIPCDECKTTGKVAPHYVAPDYCNDLNACHEFEKGLPGKVKWTYMERLTVLLGFDRNLGTSQEWGEYYWKLATATAEQRCRAFIATMEKRDDVREATESKEHGTP